MNSKTFEPKNLARVILSVGAIGLAFGIGAYNMPRSKPPIKFTPIEEASPAAPTEEILVHVVGAVRKPGLYRFKPGDRINDAIEKAGGKTQDADLAGVNLAAALQDGEQVVVPSTEAFAPMEIQPVAGLQGNISRSASSSKTPKKRPLAKAGQKSPTPPKGKPAGQSIAERDAEAKALLAEILASPRRAGGSKETSSPTKASPRIVSINYGSASELESLPGVGPATASNIIAFRRENGPFRRVDDLLKVRGIGEKKLASMRRYIRL